MFNLLSCLDNRQLYQKRQILIVFSKTETYFLKLFISQTLNTIMSYKDKIKKVKGKKGPNVMLFALSTCGWCAKVKELLDNLGFEYSYVYVDLLEKKDEEEVRTELKKYNRDFAFPTTIINKKKLIAGFEEVDIRKALK
jgi:glutaredoxin-like protein NrdH